MARSNRAPAHPLLFLLLVVLAFCLAAARATAAAAAAVSSGLLVLDPQADDPCSHAPGECGTLDSCVSALRVDVLANGSAVLTPAGVDYTLTCNGDGDGRSPPPSDPRGSVEVKCALMTALGAPATWPPPNGTLGSSKSSGSKTAPALVFDDFPMPDLPAAGRGGKALPEYARTAQHSLLGSPDSRVTTSALFSRSYFHAAGCHPFYCPTPGCSMGRAYPLIVLTAPVKGSGRVRVFAAERGFTCDRWNSTDAPFACGKTITGVTYRVAEGAVLGETAAAAGGARAVSSKDCPLGTGPGKISVPPAPGNSNNNGGLAPGPRPACVAACDGSKPEANASTVAYPLSAAPPAGACRTCPAGFAAKGPSCAACDGWNGPCCAPGYGPSNSKSCPPCPPGFSPNTNKNKKPFARLRLASVVAPNRQVSCLDFYRAAAGELAAYIYPGYLDDAAKAKAAARCPPMELTLSVDGNATSCGVRLSAPDCPALDTRAVDYWYGPQGQISSGFLGTRPLNLTGGGGPGAAAAAIRRGLVTSFWLDRYQEEDGNSTVASLEPKNGPGGRGLLALKLSPVGCVFRYSVVEGALPGGDELVLPAAAAGGRAAPLPAAAAWCPGSAPVKSAPVKLAGGEVVPVCVPK